MWAAADLVRPLWPLVEDGVLARLTPAERAEYLAGRLATCTPEDRERLRDRSVRLDAEMDGMLGLRWR